MRKMKVTEALNELKNLQARIEKQIKNASFVAAAKTNELNVKPGLSKADYKKEAESSLESIHSLIKKYRDIKDAILTSNADTEVTINGEVMTVAEAIAFKSYISFYEKLLQIMQEQYANAVYNMNSSNNRLEDKISELIATAVGKDEKAKNSDAAAEIDKAQRMLYEVSLVDPVEIKKEIDSLDDYIRGFRSSVDTALQISNCCTEIEIAA